LLVRGEVVGDEDAAGREEWHDQAQEFEIIFLLGVEEDERSLSLRDAGTEGVAFDDGDGAVQAGLLAGLSRARRPSRGRSPVW
jgi:hypothetical protein